MVKNIPFQIPTPQQKVSLAKFPIAPTKEKTLPVHAISKLMNFPVAHKKDFFGKTD